MAQVVRPLMSGSIEYIRQGLNPPAGYHPAIFPCHSAGLDEVIKANVESCLARGLPEYKPAKIGGVINIVGGGHSLAVTLDSLRESTGWIFSVNGAHDYLIERGIIPHALVLADPDPYCVGYVQKPHPNVCYIIASQCHPKVFDALEGFDVRVWHCEGDIEGAIPDGLMRVLGGTSASLRTISLGLVAGVDDFHIWGMDCAYGGRDSHIYEDKDPPEEAINIWCLGKKFSTSPAMAIQVENMKHLIDIFPMLRITPHGEGLMQTVVSHINRKRAEAAIMPPVVKG